MVGNFSQLPLPLPHAPQHDRESFFEGPSNSAALRLIDRWPDWPAPVVVLSGPPGSGKTHLARIWAERSGAAISAAAEFDRLPAAPAGSGIVVEDVGVDRIAERPLFHLINGAREAGASVLLTARLPAADWRVDLPDLRSRLRLAAPARLDAPDDDLLRKVLVKLFADRQLDVERTVLDYLLVRMERSLSTAVALVDALDRAALAAGRRVTRPLAASTLQDFSPDPQAFTETQ